MTTVNASPQSTTQVSLTAIEYLTRDLFKGRKLRTAAKAFCAKFNGQNNLFLGNVHYTVDQLVEAVLADKAQLVIAGARRMRFGNASLALEGTAQQFRLEPAVLAGAVLKILASQFPGHQVDQTDPVSGAIELLNAIHPHAPQSEALPEDEDDDSSAAPSPRG